VGLIKGFYMSLGMFTALPLPFYIWDEKLTKETISTLPLVGAIIGLLWWGIGLAFVTLNLPIVMSAAILTVVPFLITGFIHLDGYMDTSDAHLSRRDLSKRLRILKDPLVGAFAVVMLAILFLLQFAAVYTLVDGVRYLILLVTICVLSRCASAMAIFELKHMQGSNYAALIGQSIELRHKLFVIITALVTVVMAVFMAGAIGILVSVAVIVGYAIAMRVVYKSFDGVSGDLLGYSMVIGELCGLVALALLQGV